MGRGALRVDLVGGPNWAAAVAILNEGGYIIYRGIGLTAGASDRSGKRHLGVVTAEIPSEWQSENLTEARALADIERGKAVVDELTAESPDVRQLIQSQGLQFDLIDYYGMGSTLIARYKDGSIEWHHPSLRRAVERRQRLG